MQRCGWGLVAIAGLMISACATVERAPIVDDRVSAAALAAGAAPEAAPHGREVFINNCRQCHSLVNPLSMSEERWSKALVRMSRKAHLEPTDAADLRAYIFAVRAAAAPVTAPNTPPQTPPGSR